MISEIIKLKVHIVALTESKKKDEESEIVDKYLHLYGGVNKEGRELWENT